MNCYNGQRYLSEAIKSVINQTYKNWELIFYDNCSTDNSKEIFKSFNDKRLKYFKSKKKLRLYDARNMAIQKSTGKFITFLDTDDIWLQNKLKIQIQFLSKNKQAQFIYSNYYILNSKKNKYIAHNSSLSSGYITQDLLDVYRVGILTVLIDKKIFKKDNFNKKYNIIGDFDFFLNISRKIKFYAIQKPLAIYRLHNANYSKKNMKNYVIELSFWIDKNKKEYENIGFSLINQKFYSTSPIFNYYFKKNGGKLTSCTQKNICSASLSLFVFTDVMFTLGKGQGKICNKLGGKVKKFVPVGSLFMENAWFKKKKDLKKVPKTDVLILGINTLFNHRHYVNNFYKEDYYGSYLKWLKKLSIEFPEKKFVLKHHGDYTNDPEERKILKDSNIKVLIKNESINSSYAYAFKSKIVISFASTMIIEILGHGKMAYFIDPGLRGDQWYRDIKKINKFRIGNYNKLRSLITQKTKISFGSKKLSEYFCLESQNTSKLISNYFKKNKI
jgi:glycosyltransferase involved in cell wall biosynthesis